MGGAVRLSNNNPNARVSWDAGSSAKLLKLYGEVADFKEIAERLGCTKSAAHQQLSSLRQRAKRSAYWAEQFSVAESLRARLNIKRSGWPKGCPNPRAGNHSSYRAPGRVAKGKRINETMIEVGMALDDETFSEIAARAKAAERSFRAEARELIEMGLETVKAEGM